MKKTLSVLDMKVLDVVHFSGYYNKNFITIINQSPAFLTILYHIQ